MALLDLYSLLLLGLFTFSSPGDLPTDATDAAASQTDGSGVPSLLPEKPGTRSVPLPGGPGELPPVAPTLPVRERPGIPAPTLVPRAATR